MSIVKIMWGTCWYSESPDTVLSFIKNTNQILANMNISYSSVIFDAKYKRDVCERKYITDLVECSMLQCNENKYPNKNYGIAVITEFAYINHATYVAIVDSDWNIEHFDCFVHGLLLPLIRGEFEIVIPNIEPYDGRSNRLIGRPILNLFYSKYSKDIKTIFPGAFAGVVSKIRDITTSSDYHFDWGGEWDIIGGVLERNLLITAPSLGMKNVRHRSSQSKTNDAFQIWRAFFQSVSVSKLTNLKDVAPPFVDVNSESELKILYLPESASVQVEHFIEISKSHSLPSTAKQLFNMVLLPLSLMLDGIDKRLSYTLPNNDNLEPYDRSKLSGVSKMAELFVYHAIINSKISVNFLSENMRLLFGHYFGDWTAELTNNLRSTLDEQIKGVRCIWK